MVITLATDEDVEHHPAGADRYAGRGGGIMSTNSTTVRDSVLSANSADLGGGIYNDVKLFGFETLDVRGSTSTGNFAVDAGGGIYNAGTLTVSSSSFNSNFSVDYLGTYSENNIYGPYTDRGGNSFS